ncbi:hypothetical protein BWI17_11260 [Betaproteobacteria bacterium GR16-43]|nr:hypothetical protein BWI17_11260 [Betaproteobacteria bacterium GR16-43]
MKNHLKLRNAALVVALAAVAASSWAATEYFVYKDGVLVAQSDTLPPEAAPIVTPLEPLPPTESLSSNETVIVPATNATPAPVAEPNPPITVEDRRLTVDERIQALVMDKLAQSPNLSGKIGVESKDSVVTLTGYTSTAGQAYRAGRYAGSVDGVKSVQNEIRPRIGGSV